MSDAEEQAFAAEKRRFVLRIAAIDFVVIAGLLGLFFLDLLPGLIFPVALMAATLALSITLMLGLRRIAARHHARAVSPVRRARD